MTIPKIMHFVWVGSPLPIWAGKNINTWEEHHPDWDIWLWDDWAFTGEFDLRNRALYDRAEEIVHPHSVGQFRADIARYEILHRHGGFYADVDTRCLRPIDEALSGHSEFAVREDPSWVANTYLASEPGSPVMDRLIEEMPAHVAKLKSPVAAALASGPQYVTPTWERMGAYVDSRTGLWFPYNWRDVKRGGWIPKNFDPDAYAEHQWSHVRTLSGRPLQ